jgi:hypothetical protein
LTQRIGKDLDGGGVVVGRPHDDRADIRAKAPNKADEGGGDAARQGDAKGRLQKRLQRACAQTLRGVFDVGIDL